MPKGWKHESKRHALASRGISTGRKNTNMARYGSQNGRWRGGVSKTYYRRIAGCECNDGTIVHHKDHNKFNPSPENLEVIEPTSGMSARGIHSQQHPEKGYRDRPRAFARWVDKLRNERDRDWRNWRFSCPKDKGRYTYGEMQGVLLEKEPKSVQAYYKDNYYNQIKFRVG